MLNETYGNILFDVTAGGERDIDRTITTGYKILDKSLNGGLRLGCCYLITGLEKSGKTSLLLNIINDRVMDDKKCALLSTEMDFPSVIGRMLKISGVDSDKISEASYWRKQMEKYFSFYGKQELTTLVGKALKHDFKKFLAIIDELEKEEVELVVIDNLTTFGAEAGDYKILGNLTNELITYVKDKKIAVVFVLHVKPSVAFRDTPKGIKDLIFTNNPEGIFNNSVTIIQRPTLNDVYGGGQALSQISGAAIILWRPFQKYSVPSYQRIGMLVIDTHRFGPSCDVRIEFDGDRGKFWELEIIDKR